MEKCALLIIEFSAHLSGSVSCVDKAKIILSG